MLHKVPNSIHRRRLFAVLAMQRRLIKALCSLEVGSVVDQSWLKSVWPKLPQKWVERFWTLDKCRRAEWIATIAAATLDKKEIILDMMNEQLRFSELYATPPTVRLKLYPWKKDSVLEAVNKLLKDFYDPFFYKDEGFPIPATAIFHKDNFIAGFKGKPKVCPYTDSNYQDIKLDHFFPKDEFPMLSCHPDNLIPCSTDSNSFGHKSTKKPLDINNQNQAELWFHPRWRSAEDKYTLEFDDSSINPSFQFLAKDPPDQVRLNNMNDMFGLTEFWGRDLDDELQLMASQVAEILRNDKLVPSQDEIVRQIRREAQRKKKFIGHEALAIVKSHFYEHIIMNSTLLEEVVRTCTKGI
jgi:hypothetical protein